ncbi:MAG: type II secretion system protein [Candidatus Omnitrophica bacterium]|nr:type II secretion system protein [Candidatus Omnitrophota bacterium]
MHKKNLLFTVNKAPSSAGFTLVEIILAAGILGIILSVMLSFFVNAIALNKASRDLTIAVSHAQYVLEDIRNASFYNVPSQIDSGVWTWDAKAVTDKGLHPLKNEQITTTKVGTELLTVTVTVTWGDASGRPESLVLMTHMAGA